MLSLLASILASRNIFSSKGDCKEWNTSFNNIVSYNFLIVFFPFLAMPTLVSFMVMFVAACCLRTHMNFCVVLLYTFSSVGFSPS